MAFMFNVVHYCNQCAKPANRGFQEGLKLFISLNDYKAEALL